MSWILSLGYILKLQKLYISVIRISCSGIYVLFFLTSILQNSSCEENHLSDSFPVSGLVPLFVLNWKAHWAAKQGFYCRLISRKSSSEIRRFLTLVYFMLQNISGMINHYFLLPALHLNGTLLTCCKRFVACCSSLIDKQRVLVNTSNKVF